MRFNATVTLGEMLILFIIFTALARIFLKVRRIYRTKKMFEFLKNMEREGKAKVVAVKRIDQKEQDKKKENK